MKVVFDMSVCPYGTTMYVIRPGDTLWLIARKYNTTIDEILAVNPRIDLNNLYVGQTICLRPGFRVLPSGAYPDPAGVNKAQVDLNNYIRMLWEQHVFWTRLAILSIVFDLPDANATTSRLLRNPKDFEVLLRPLYGDGGASRFADLLTSHLVIASELVKAAKAGNNRAMANAENRWYANADEIAAFLASINPYWSEVNWKAMLHEHLALTKTEAVDMLTGRYADSITVFDQIERQALGMADVMTDGVIRQFPNQFS
jgi:LysM repeat protein